MARTKEQIEQSITNKESIMMLEYLKDYFVKINNLNVDKLNAILQDIYSHVNGLDAVVGHLGKPLAPSATAPTNPNEYDWYFDTGTQNFMMYHNGGWEVMAHLSATVDLINYYTKSEVDTELNKKANVGASYTKAETDNKFSSKVESDTKYATKAELANVNPTVDAYTKAETDSKLGERDTKINTNTSNIAANTSKINALSGGVKVYHYVDKAAADTAKSTITFNEGDIAWIGSAGDWTGYHFTGGNWVLNGTTSSHGQSIDAYTKQESDDKYATKIALGTKADKSYVDSTFALKKDVIEVISPAMQMDNTDSYLLLDETTVVGNHTLGTMSDGEQVDINFEGASSLGNVPGDDTQVFVGTTMAVRIPNSSGSAALKWGTKTNPTDINVKDNFQRYTFRLEKQGNQFNFVKLELIDPKVDKAYVDQGLATKQDKLSPQQLGVVNGQTFSLANKNKLDSLIAANDVNDLAKKDLSNIVTEKEKAAFIANLTRIGINVSLFNEFKGVHGSDPAGPHQELDWYINNANYVIKVWHNSSWHTITSPHVNLTENQILTILRITAEDFNNARYLGGQRAELEKAIANSDKLIHLPDNTVTELSHKANVDLSNVAITGHNGKLLALDNSGNIDFVEIPSATAGKADLTYVNDELAKKQNTLTKTLRVEFTDGTHEDFKVG